MAKNQKFELDDKYGLGNSELDYSAFDFDMPEMKDDRKPITKLKDAFVGGAKDTVTNPSFFARLVKQAMPKGYGVAIDLADESLSTLKNLYNTTAQEIKPIIGDIKRTTKRVMPNVSAVLPKDAAAAIKKWAESNPDRRDRTPTAEEWQTASIQNQLGEIFQLEAVSGMNRNAELDARQNLRDGIDHMRHRDMLGQMDSMRISLQQMANYQNKVESNYQRKSLELQFRQYFVAVDLLNEQKRSNLNVQFQLKAIANNTGLPDFVKTTPIEKAQEMLRNRFLKSAGNSILGAQNGFIRRFGEQLSKGVKDKISGFTNDFSMGLGAVDQMADAHEMNQSMSGMGGASGKEMAAGFAGGIAADSVGSALAKKFKVKFGSNKKIADIGEKAHYFGKNAMPIAMDWARSTKGESKAAVEDWNPNILDRGLRFVKDTLIKTNSLDTNLQVDKDSNLLNPDVTRRSTNKTITEIIPGYLARIYREIKILRTGDTNTKLVGYDFTTNKFADNDTIGRNILKKIVGAGTMDSTKYFADKLISQVEDKDNPLTPEQKAQLRKQFIIDNLNTKTGSKERLTKTETYQNGAKEHAEVFAKMFEKFFSDNDPKKQRKFAEEFNTLGGGITDPRKQIQDLHNLGMGEHLEKLGLINAEQERIDLNRYYQYFGEDNHPGLQTPPTGGPRSRRRGRIVPLGRGPHGSDIGNNVPPQPPTPQQPSERPGFAPFNTNDLQNLYAQRPASFTSAWQSVRGAASNFAAQHQPTVDAVRQQGQEYVDSTKQSMHNLMEEHKPKVEQFIQRGKDYAQQVTQKAKNVVDAYTPDAQALLNKANQKRISLQDSLLQSYQTFMDKLNRKRRLPTGEVVDDTSKQQLPAFSSTFYPNDPAATPKATESNSNIGKPPVTETPAEERKKSQLETISETLLRIEKKLNEGIDLHGGGEGKKKGKGWWWNRSLKDSVTGTVGAGLGLANKAQRHIRESVGNVLGLGGRVLGSAAKTVGDVAGSALHIGTSRLLGIRDVYVEGERGPRLTARKLRNGDYRDAKNPKKIIKRIGDISGAVINEKGEEVLAESEIRNAYINDGLVKKTLKAAGVVLKFGKELGDNLFKVLPAFYRAGVWAVKQVAGLLYLPQDIYVKGKPNPVLLAKTMRAGGYRSAVTGKVIKHPGQIDGPVEAFDGTNWNLALSAEELAGGVFDSHGRPIKVGLAKLFGMASSVARFGFNQAKKVVGAVKKAGEVVLDMGMRGLNVGKNLLLHGVAGLGMDQGGVGKKKQNLMLERLTEIRDLLAERLPKRKRHIVGDTNDDGVREGSYEDQMNKRKAAALAATQNAKSDAAGKAGGIGAKLTGLLGLLSGKKKKEGEEEEGGDGGGGMMETAAGVAAGGAASTMAGKAWAATKKLGFKGVGKFALKRVLGPLAALYGGYEAYQNVKEGSYGKAALNGGLAVGGLAASGATAAAVTGGLGTAATVGGGILAGTAALLASPVVLAGLAIAAAGTGAYYGYKALTNKRLKTLSKVRYAQYGFAADDNQERVNTVFGLEDTLMSAVTYKDGIAELNTKKINLENVLKDFGLMPKNEKHVVRFRDWFMGRFKPVFLSHLTALKSVNPKVALGDVDSDALTSEEKAKYLNLAKFPEGPYNVAVSPFLNMTSLQCSGSEVASLVAAAEAEIKKDTKDPKKKSTSDLTPKAAAVGATALAAAVPVDPAKKDKVPASTISGIKKTTQSAANLGDDASVISVMGVSIAQNRFASGKVEALDSIRYKTYGLNELEMEKVRSLDQLETLISKKISFSKGNVATWRGSVDRTLMELGTAFGVVGVSNNNASAWTTWFSLRFLPTYLAFLGAKAAATGKPDASSSIVGLSPQQMLDVAKAVVGTTSNFNGSKVSVWTLPATPWPKYDLNLNSKSVDPNMDGMKEQVKQTTLDEASGKSDLGGVSKAKTESKTPAPDTKPKGFIDNATNSIAKTFTAAKDSVTSWFGGKPSAPTIPSKNADGAVPTGAREIIQPGKGSGGDINDIPMPKGNKTWAAVKDTILSAAKMVGVDSNLMSAMAAIESGFDHTIKATTSSATGLYQFITGTWKWMLNKYGSKYGIAPSTLPTDPRANALMGAEYIKENMDTLKGVINRPLTDTDLYLAHFLGSGGAKKFLTADPNAIGSVLMPKEAGANPGIFIQNGKPATVGEIYTLLSKRIQTKGKQLGVSVGAEDLVTKASTGAAAIMPAAGADPGKSTMGGTVPKSTPMDKVATKPSVVKSIPVMEQTPGGTSTAPVVKAPVGNSTGAEEGPMQVVKITRPKVDPTALMMGQGFMSARARDLTEQTKYQRDLATEAIGKVDISIQASVTVQKEMLDVLKGIHGLMGAKPKKTADIKDIDPKEVALADTAKTPPNLRLSKPMTRAPVSMSKAAT